MFFLTLVIYIIAQVDHIEIDYIQFKESLDHFIEKEMLCDYYSNDLVYGIIILWNEEEQESIISVSSVGNDFIPYRDGFQLKGVLYHDNRFFVRISNHKKAQKVYSQIFRVIGTYQIEYTQIEPGYFENYIFAYEHLNIILMNLKT